MIAPPVLSAAVGASAVEGVAPRADGPLVTSCISQNDRLELYPVSLRVKRENGRKNNQIPPDRTEINSFSDHSRRRLRFRALNAFPALISQFGLTYHDQWPTDGRESKKHLNAWLSMLRLILPGVGYLWILEFQKRNAPHYHIFLTVPPDEETRLKLADAWCRITAPGDAAALRFHRDARNWIPWVMGSGAYLCKYLDKEAQKAIPEGYHRFGRFWGNSRGLEPVPISIRLDDIDRTAFDRSTGEILDGSKQLLRWLGRYDEKQTRGRSRFRRRTACYSYTMLKGAAVYEQIERYFSRTAQPPPRRDDAPPF